MTAPSRASRRYLVAWAGALAFLLAGAWSALVSERVIVPEPPDVTESDDGMREYWLWFADAVPLLQLGYFALLVAVAALAATAAASSPGRRPLSTHAIVAGMALWAVATCIRLGTDRAVALLATHENPIQATNSIHFTLAWVASAFELVGSVAAGVGLIMMATTGRRRVVGILAGAGLIVLGVCLYVPAGEVTAIARVAVGGVLLPWWLIESALVSRTERSPAFDR